MVRLIDVCKVYENGTPALKGINLRIDDGDFVFLVGTSASGKTTIVKSKTAIFRNSVAPLGSCFRISA